MKTDGERELILKGRKFDFESITFAGKGDKLVRREMVRHPGAVVILPLLETEEGIRIVMIRVYRFTVGRELWELPAGTMEAGEDPAFCAGRELEEETGYRAASIAPLGTFYTTPGMTDERMHAFVASGLTHVGQKLEEDERIDPVPTEASTVMKMLDRRDIVDAKSMLTLLMAVRAGVIAPNALGKIKP